MGEDAGAVARGTAGACVASIGLSDEGEIGGSDGDDAVTGRGGGTEAAMGCAGVAIAVGVGFGTGGGIGVDVGGGAGIVGSGALDAVDISGVALGNGCIVGVEMGAGVTGVGIWLGIGVDE